MATRKKPTLRAAKKTQASGLCKAGSGARPRFTAFASKIAAWSGRPGVFLTACVVVIIWAAAGPFFDYSNTWQLAINSTTTIITFLMVFLIQNTQTRDTYAMQLKLDELIRATEGAHTVLLDLEELSEEDLIALRDQYEALATKARKRVQAGGKDTDMPDIKLN
jgi:low affinity Fe/Cu permease